MQANVWVFFYTATIWTRPCSIFTVFKFWNDLVKQRNLRETVFSQSPNRAHAIYSQRSRTKSNIYLIFSRKSYIYSDQLLNFLQPPDGFVMNNRLRGIVIYSENSIVLEISTKKLVQNDILHFEFSIGRKGTSELRKKHEYNQIHSILNLWISNSLKRTRRWSVIVINRHHKRNDAIAPQWWSLIVSLISSRIDSVWMLLVKIWISKSNTNCGDFTFITNKVWRFSSASSSSIWWKNCIAIDIKDKIDF